MKGLMSIDSEQKMSSREIAELTGKAHKHVLADIRKMLKELEIDSAVVSAQYIDTTGRALPCFKLNRELTDCLLTGYSAKLRMAVIKRWHELEAEQKASLPDFSDPIAAAMAWIESEKAKQLAIATKAEIGEASAMNTASQAVKKADKLEVELDKSKEWSTIKRMEMLTGLKFNWRILKSAGVDLGIPAKDVYDPNFGTVKAYHESVWAEAYALDIEQ